MVPRKYELVMNKYLLQNSKYIKDAIQDVRGTILALVPRIPGLKHFNSIFNEVD